MTSKSRQKQPKLSKRRAPEDECSGPCTGKAVFGLDLSALTDAARWEDVPPQLQGRIERAATRFGVIFGEQLKREAQRKADNACAENGKDCVCHNPEGGLEQIEEYKIFLGFSRYIYGWKMTGECKYFI